MVKPSVCDICAFKIVDGQNFCSGCGVDLGNLKDRNQKRKMSQKEEERKSSQPFSRGKRVPRMSYVS